MNRDNDELLAWLAEDLHGMKWDDFADWLRPRESVKDDIAEFTEKYIDKATFIDRLWEAYERLSKS